MSTERNLNKKSQGGLCRLNSLKSIKTTSDTAIDYLEKLNKKLTIDNMNEIMKTTAECMSIEEIKEKQTGPSKLLINANLNDFPNSNKDVKFNAAHEFDNDSIDSDEDLTN